MERKITKLMVFEHGEMLGLIAKFRRELEYLDKFDSANRTFNKYKEIQKGHIKLEEESILKMDDSKEHKNIIDIIKKQHNEIEVLIKKIDSNLENRKHSVSDIESLQLLMKKHTQLEEDKFYPDFEDELVSDERKEILEKIKKFEKVFDSVQIID